MARHSSTPTPPAGEASAKRSTQSEKKANEQQPGSYSEEETDEKIVEIPPSRPGREADPRPRFLSRLGRAALPARRRASRLLSKRIAIPGAPSSRTGEACSASAGPPSPPGRRPFSPGSSLDEALARHRALVRAAGRAAPSRRRRSRSRTSGGDDVTAADRRPGRRHPAAASPRDARRGRLAPAHRHRRSPTARFAPASASTWQAERSATPISFDGSVDQRAARRRPHLRLGRAAPLGAVVDRQPRSSTRGAAADPGGRLAQGASRRRSGRRGSPGSGRGRSTPSPASCRSANGPQHAAPARRARPGDAAAPASSSAASRTMQWGGSGRPESLRSLLQRRWSAATTATTPATTDATSRATSSPASTRATRWRLGERRTLSIYGQAIGEDEAGNTAEPLPRQHRRRRRLRRRRGDGARLRRARQHDDARRVRHADPRLPPTGTHIYPTATRSAASRSAIRPAATSA